MTVALTLIGKPDCHLCDDARAVVGRVLAELEASDGSPAVTLEELSIAEDEALRERYWEMIPVVLIDGGSTATGASTPNDSRTRSWRTDDHPSHRHVEAER